MRKLLILGAGGHGKVVADAAESSGRWSAIAFLDDRHPILSTVGIWPVLGTCADLQGWRSEEWEAIAAIGDAPQRMEMIAQLAAAGIAVATVIHASAIVSRLATVEAGAVVLAGAVVNPGARVGRGCIVNTGAIVEHDCLLEEGVHIASGACLGGGVTVAANSLIGTSACIRNGLSIGRDATIGAGAVVVANVGDGTTVVGVPAREMIGSGRHNRGEC
jgi:sugar O-acyltransferase (sialic acid O-acetyltransferase NeuD family)